MGISTILITEAAGQGSQGLGMAIAGDVADHSIHHILNPTTEPVSWIGVHLQDATPDLQQAFGLSQGGPFYSGLMTGSPGGAPALVSAHAPGTKAE